MKGSDNEQDVKGCDALNKEVWQANNPAHCTNMGEWDWGMNELSYLLSLTKE